MKEVETAQLIKYQLLPVEISHFLASCFVVSVHIVFFYYYDNKILIEMIFFFFVLFQVCMRQLSDTHWLYSF